MKDLSVRFEGLRTARVYPATLPNLPAGTQQVILGRFLPTGAAQKGRIVVTGNLDGKPVRYSADLELAEGEAGNSFVPRLWARRHLDALLAEGRSKEIEEEIVSFSEEFGIMTPYTSFLVLESDEDRERYGVQRRVKMRDGERFFAAGRDQAATQLLQQQMKLARTWRKRLRLRMLREIATLGKHLHRVAYGWADTPVAREEESGRLGYVGGDQAAGARYFRGQAEELSVNEFPDERVPDDEMGEPDGDEDADFEEAGEEAASERDGHFDAKRPSRERAKKISLLRSAYAPSAGRGPVSLEKRLDARYVGWHVPSMIRFADFRFPGLAPPPAEKEEPPEVSWPAEVIRLVRSLDRRPALHALKGGVELKLRGGSLHALRGFATSHEEAFGLYGGAGWYVRTRYGRGEPHDTWVFRGTRGALSVGVRLGRRRRATDKDGKLVWTFPFRDFSAADLLRRYASYTAQGPVVDEEGVASIVLRAPEPQKTEFHLKIDVNRAVLMEWKTIHAGKTTSTTRFSGFVKAGGTWWATKLTHLDQEGRTTARHELAVRELEEKELQEALQRSLSGHEDVIFVGNEDPDLAASKQAAHEKRAGFAEHFRVALHFAASQQWERVWTSWRAAEAKVVGKPGATWIAAALMTRSRKGQELKELLGALAPAEARSDGPATNFLVQHIFQLARNTYQANEMLELLDVLRPAFFRAGEELEQRKAEYWRMRGDWLQRARQPHRALELRKRLAAARPFDLNDVARYLDALSSAQAYDAAIGVIEKALAGQKWLDHEASSFYGRWTNLLWQRRDISKLLEICDEWIAAAPTMESAYTCRLSTLLFLDRENDADGRVAARLGAEIPEKPEAAARARLGAAIQFALGQGWNYHARRMEDKWHKPLAALARRLARQEQAPLNLAYRIITNWRFRRTDAHAALRKALLADLSAENAIETMSLQRLARYLIWIPWGKNQVDADMWREVTDRVRARFGKAKKNHERGVLAGHVLQLLDAHGEEQEAIDFLRLRFKGADDETRPQIATQLMSRLATREWTTALEDEILALVPAVQPSKAEEEQRRANSTATIRWLSDALERMRFKALLGPAKEYETLSRKELKAKKRVARAGARRGLAGRFKIERDRAHERARPWYQLERLCFLAQLGGDLKEVGAETRELYASARPDGQSVWDRVLRERCAYVLEYAATRRKAPDGLADGVVEFLKKRATAKEPRGEDRADKSPWNIPWKMHLFRLLIALDRPDDVVPLLQDWITPSKVESLWRIALGYIEAERGKLDEAVEAFSAVARIDELGSAEYAALADWYLVLDEEKKREKALLARYEVMPEQRLRNRLRREQNRISRRGDGVPAELDPDVLRALRALLSKASYPANYTGRVAGLYRIVKDFRLLESLPYGVIGHSPEGIYPFLQGVGGVVREVHEEATCDALAARIRELSEEARSDVDRRALRLLSSLVERRASEVLNAPGPHVRKALAEMKAAFPGSWLPGERRLMATFLASLGRITQAALAEEQVRQLTGLHRLEKAPLDRLKIAVSLYTTHWNYKRHDKAIDGLESALAEYSKGLAQEAQQAFGLLVGWMTSRHHYGRAEGLIEEAQRSPHNAAMGAWLAERLFVLYVDALRNRGSVSFGRGEQLYVQARVRMEAALQKADRGHVQSLLSPYCALHQVAHRNAGIGIAAADFERFANEKFPELVSVVPSNAHSMAHTVAYALKALRDARVALAFLIGRVETEPSWYARVGRDGWPQFGYTMASWRVEAEPLGKLEPRLEAIVLKELERDLLSLESRSRAMYHIDQRHFWSVKRDRFKAVALKVIELNPDSPARLLYAARYLWTGLRLRDRAIDVLLDAEGRGMLREGGRHQLVLWLHHEERYAGSLPVLVKLVSEWPDRLDYRTLKIRALHEVGRDPDALELLDETQKRFKKGKRWTEHVLAALARICRTCRFHERAAVYYEEVIPLHQRTQPNRGVGGGTLSRYYGEVAEVFLELGSAEKAVDAASAAVVSWGRTHGNRAQALEALRSVILRIGDLDAFVKDYDRRVEGSGLDAPLLRKTIGAAYLERGEAEKALPQLFAARDLQPADVETHAAILRAYDALKRPKEACVALRGSIKAAPMNLSLYTELGKRLASLGDVHGAERAWTSLVEAQPNEAESHRLLANHREAQRRFASAVVQWRQVVRVRRDEPDGWIMLAKAQIAAGQTEEARKTLKHILATEWAARFGDVGKRLASVIGDDAWRLIGK
ncbi:MAG: hypothetical protein O7E54_09840 [Planctomycetota bacterium]|nr:hypothetical protein [Planctomycetota bacterium]